MTAKWKSLIGSGVGGVAIMACLEPLREHGYLPAMPLPLRLLLCGILGAAAFQAARRVFYHSGKH